MDEDGYEEAEYGTYRWMSNAFVGLAVLGVTGGAGTLLGLVISRPWSEGAVVGTLFGVALMWAQLSNREFAEYWESETRRDFERSQRELEEAWKREQSRPDDEYVGW